MSGFTKKRCITAFLLSMTIVMVGVSQPVVAFANVEESGSEYETVLDTADQDSSSEDVTESSSQVEEEAPPAPVVDPAEKYKGEIASINDKIAGLAEEKKLLEKNINEAKTTKAKQVAIYNSIDAQIRITKDEIALLLSRITLLEENIAGKQTQIETKQKDYDDKYALFLKRMRSMYMLDDSSRLSLLLGAGSFSDLLTKVEMLSSVANYDNNLMIILSEERVTLEQEKSKLEQERTDVAADKVLVEAKQKELGGQLSTVSLRIQDIAQEEKDFKANLAANQAKSAAMESSLKEIYKKIEYETHAYIGGAMLWPVPGYYNITSNYGMRFSGNDLHTGMDISGSGIYGKPVVAANDGTVKIANWSYAKGVDYGIYVMLDHGGKTTTLYAHLSNILVKVGDPVKKGDPIGEVGSTGWSTGPHLHFEVRENGVHKNPISYVKA